MNKAQASDMFEMVALAIIKDSMAMVMKEFGGEKLVRLLAGMAGDTADHIVVCNDCYQDYLGDQSVPLYDELASLLNKAADTCREIDALLGPARAKARAELQAKMAKGLDTVLGAPTSH